MNYLDKFDVEDVGVPDDEGESWAHVAARLRESKPDDVVYVPKEIGGPGENYYDIDLDQIVLDENLREWPDVHDRILSHERKHREYGYGPVGTLKNLFHEFKTDLFIHFSRTDAAERNREYLFQDFDQDIEWTELGWILSGKVINLLRGIWLLAMVPLGGLYREVRDRAD